MKKILTIYIILLSTLFTSAQNQINVEYQTYFALVNDFPALINVNMELVDYLPVNGLDLCAIVTIPFNTSDGNGFPSENENQLLNEIVEAINNQLPDKVNCILTGWNDSNNARSIYLYLNNQVRLQPILENVFKTYSSFNYDLQIKSDPNWDIYVDFLYPSPYNINALENTLKLNEIENKGITLNNKEKLKHTAYFFTDTERSAFEIKVVYLGYKIIRKSKVSNEDFSYEISFSKVSETEIIQLNDLTWQLVNLAEDYGGYYNGWQLLK